MFGLTLDELLMTEEDDCSTFLLDDDAFELELDFAELLLFTELLLDDFLVVVDDDDLTMLDDDSFKDGFAGLLSSPHAARKSEIQTEAQKTNLFILRIYKKSRLRRVGKKATPSRNKSGMTLSAG
jgi:hypothetical protein